MYDGMVITIVTEVKGCLCCATLCFDLYCVAMECRSEFTTIRCSVQDEISVYCFLPFSTADAERQCSRSQAERGNAIMLVTSRVLVRRDAQGCSETGQPSQLATRTESTAHN